MPVIPELLPLVTPADAGGDVPPPMHVVPVGQARLAYRGLMAMQVPPARDVLVRDVQIPRPADRGDIYARSYTGNTSDDGAGSRPGLVLLHGGWFALGDLDVVDEPARALARRTGAVIVSVDYRLAPEHPYPAGLEDSVTATNWVLDHAAELGVDPRRVHVLGESAGGTLALGLAVALRGAAARPAGVIALYPPTHDALDTESWVEHDGLLLDSAGARHFWSQYLAGTTDPLARPGAWAAETADPLDDLPPLTVLTAEHDPLRDEGESFTHLIAGRGAVTTLIRLSGVTHGLLYMSGLAPHAVSKLHDHIAGAMRPR